MPSAPGHPGTPGAPDSLLRRAATRAAEEPFFLASALAVYRIGEDLDDRRLAQRLGCAPADLSRLALCRRPDSGDATFHEDVQRIAAWAHVDADVLVNVLRYAESVAALRRLAERLGATAGAHGTLLAARHRDAAQPHPRHHRAPPPRRPGFPPQVGRPEGEAPPAAPAAPSAPSEGAEGAPPETDHHDA